MSGHSKWSQIKHKKGLADQRKGALFGKLSKMILVAARDNPDPHTNTNLYSAVERARSFDMPQDNIDRLLKRISNRREAQLFELVLEAFGPGGVGMIITAITDNKNRTIGEVRNVLIKNRAQLSGQGSVMWMFRKEGTEFIPASLVPVDETISKQLESLFEALDSLDDVQEIFSNNETQNQG